MVPCTALTTWPPAATKRPCAVMRYGGRNRAAGWCVEPTWLPCACRCEGSRTALFVCVVLRQVEDSQLQRSVLPRCSLRCPPPPNACTHTLRRPRACRTPRACRSGCCAVGRRPTARHRQLGAHVVGQPAVEALEDSPHRAGECCGGRACWHSALSARASHHTHTHTARHWAPAHCAAVGACPLLERMPGGPTAAVAHEWLRSLGRPT
jgi:hypothetical protein